MGCLDGTDHKVEKKGVSTLFPKTERIYRQSQITESNKTDNKH